MSSQAFNDTKALHMEFLNNDKYHTNNVITKDPSYSIFIQGRIVHTFRLETLNPTSDAVIPTRLKKVTIDEISSASA